MKILIVDDETFILDFLTELLSMNGYRVTKESSPKEAIKIIENEKFNVAVIDYSMPEVNGTDLVRLIKEQDPMTKVIGISAVAHEELFYDAGADHFLKKPFSTDQILNLINGF